MFKFISSILRSIFGGFDNDSFDAVIADANLKLVQIKLIKAKITAKKGLDCEKEFADWAALNEQLKHVDEYLTNSINILKP